MAVSHFHAPQQARLTLRRSRKGADVLVHVEEVARIILGLVFLESPVVGLVRCGHRIPRLVVVQVIDITAGGHEGLHRRIGVPSPGDAPISVGPVHPFRQHGTVVAVSRWGKAVSPIPTRVAAPWRCSRSMWSIGDGHQAKHSIIVSMTSSLNWT